MRYRCSLYFKVVQDVKRIIFWSENFKEKNAEHKRHVIR